MQNRCIAIFHWVSISVQSNQMTDTGSSSAVRNICRQYFVEDCHSATESAGPIMHHQHSCYGHVMKVDRNHWGVVNVSVPVTSEWY